MNKKEVSVVVSAIGAIVYLVLVIIQGFMNNDETIMPVLNFIGLAISLLLAHLYYDRVRDPDPDEPKGFFRPSIMTGIWVLNFVIQTLQFLHNL